MQIGCVCRRRRRFVVSMYWLRIGRYSNTCVRACACVPLRIRSTTTETYVLTLYIANQTEHINANNNNCMLEWTMLMYGESILSLLTIDIPQESSPYYLTFYFSLATVILLHYLHFRSQPHDADDHVFRLSKDRSLVWKVFWYAYSASLIALGSAYTLFVQSFSYAMTDYEEDDAAAAADDGHSRRMTAPTTSEGRHLAAGAGSGDMAFPPKEMIQRAAYMFSASLAMVFLCMDAMSLMHIGWERSQDRCYCPKARIANMAGIGLIGVRIVLIGFCATLGIWCSTNLEVLSGTGLVVTIVQLMLRRLGDRYLTAKVGHAVDDTEALPSDVGSSRCHDIGQ
jgi:hypothetical protein